MILYQLGDFIFLLSSLPCLAVSGAQNVLLNIIHTYRHRQKPRWDHQSKQESLAAAKLLQKCPTLCDPIDGSPPGSPISGILQARTLEWVAISFSNA